MQRGGHPSVYAQHQSSHVASAYRMPSFGGAWYHELGRPLRAEPLAVLFYPLPHSIASVVMRPGCMQADTCLDNALSRHMADTWLVKTRG